MGDVYGEKDKDLEFMNYSWNKEYPRIPLTDVTPEHLHMKGGVKIGCACVADITLFCGGLRLRLGGDRQSYNRVLESLYKLSEQSIT